MAINLQKTNGDDALMIDINTTPLIDVMLVLLIMLIITIPVQTDATKLDMPRGNPPPVMQPAVVDLAIDFDGTTTWNGTVVPDRESLEQHLDAAARRQPQPEIHIAPNKLARYSYVAMVLAESQRLGLAKIGLVGSEQFMQ